MQETAKEYFKDKLPENIGDTTIIYLDEMIEKDLFYENTFYILDKEPTNRKNE